MTPYPVVVEVTTPLVQCARLMDDREIGALGVMRDDKLVGVLTDRDIVVRAIARQKDARETTAGDVASPDPVSLAGDATIEDAERCMLERAVRRLFVLGDDGRPVGILTLDDLMALRDPDSIVGKQLREYGMDRGDMGFTRG